MNVLIKIRRKLFDNMKEGDRFLVKTHGAIIIEFAFFVPVLFLLILYIHDISKIGKIHKTLDFCTTCAVNMFQNISQNRSNKKITRLDYKHIHCASFLPYYGGHLEQYDDNSVLPASLMHVYYLKGLGKIK